MFKRADIIEKFIETTRVSAVAVYQGQGLPVEPRYHKRWQGLPVEPHYQVAGATTLSQEAVEHTHLCLFFKTDDTCSEPPHKH